jgi:hypothetical protein
LAALQVDGIGKLGDAPELDGRQVLGELVRVQQSVDQLFVGYPLIVAGYNL